MNEELVSIQTDRIRALEMVVQVMAKVIDARLGNALDDMRDTIDRRLIELETAEQLPGRGGATRRSLELAREILGEAPTPPQRV
jgi:hypothetical protein